MSRNHSVTKLIALLCALVAGTAEAVQRAHVASYGLDSNTSFSCSVANPCRFFQAATTVVDPNGEVVVLDSAGYGAVILTQSISLVAPSGVYAGISVFPGATGITIATAGIKVVLRGLTINSQGGSAGVMMTAGDSLSIENSVISNFSNGNGILVDTPAKVSVIDTVLRNNISGILLQGGAVADISRASIHAAAGGSGIQIYGVTPGTVTTAVISDSTISFNVPLSSGSIGIHAYSTVSNANVRVAVIRSAVADGSHGIVSQAGPSGFTLLAVSKSMATGNAFGFFQSGASAFFETLGNNTVQQNTNNSSGTITAVTPL